MKQIALVPVLLLSFVVFSMFSPAVTMQAQEAVLLYTRRDESTGINSLYVLNVDTGEQKSIADTALLYRAGWSPDGRLWVADSVSYNDDTGRFRFLDVETGEESILSEQFILNVDQCFPALLWSPDGQSFAYVTVADNERLLNIRHLSDESSYTVPFAEGEYLAYWSGDGEYLFTHSGSGMDRLLSAGDGSEILVGESIEFSPDVRFVAYREDEVIWLYELATGERQNPDISGRISAWYSAFMLIRAEGTGILWRYDMATGELTSLEIMGDMADYSPDQRYLVLHGYNAVNTLYLYDTQRYHLMPLETGFQVRFAGWTEDENRILLYADFEENKPQTLLRYDLETGEAEAVFETDGTLWSMEAHGDWWFIRYSPVAGDNAGAKFLLRHRETGVEHEVDMYFDPYPPDYFVSLSPDGRWLALIAADEVYRFDLSSSGSELELLAPTDDLNSGVTAAWSGDSRYMVFNVGERLYLWNVERESVEPLPDGIFGTTAWKTAGQHYVMLCSGGGDGNA